MQPAATYTNPVWPHYLADPFVLRTGDAWYAYGTGPAGADGRQFPVLRSVDLAHWEDLGHALVPRADGPPGNYWAPEVAERDGVFYLYYSASTTPSDESHRLRVATADRPEGPFADDGKELMPGQGFTIDAHPFRDPRTGRWFLYFATDYLHEEPYGTGVGVVALNDDLRTTAG